MMRLATMLAALVIVSPQAAAQDDAEIERRHSPEYRTCMRSGDAAQGVTIGIMNCLGTEIDRQDAELNRRYRSTMASLKPAQRPALRQSERRWIIQRDEQCRQAADESGGSLSGILYNDCILDQTIRRTIWLETYQP